MDEYDDYLDENEDFDMDDEENGYHDDAPRITFKQTAVSSNINRFGLPSNYKGSVAVSDRNGSRGRKIKYLTYNKHLKNKLLVLNPYINHVVSCLFPIFIMKLSISKTLSQRKIVFKSCRNS